MYGHRTRQHLQTPTNEWLRYSVNSVNIQNYEISIKTVSETTGIHFQPIPPCGDSISVAETVFNSYQGSRTLRNTLSFSGDHLWFLMHTRFLMPHRLYIYFYYSYMISVGTSSWDQDLQDFCLDPRESPLKKKCRLTTWCNLSTISESVKIITNSCQYAGKQSEICTKLLILFVCVFLC